MDILDNSLSVVAEKLRAWIPWKGNLSECAVDSYDYDEVWSLCFQCNFRFDAFDQRCRCCICGRLFCLRCMQRDTVSTTSNCETGESLGSKEVSGLSCMQCFAQSGQESVAKQPEENLRVDLGENCRQPSLSCSSGVVGYTTREGDLNLNQLSGGDDSPSSDANGYDGLPQGQSCSLNTLNVCSILPPLKVLPPVSIRCTTRSDEHEPSDFTEADAAGLNYLTPRCEYCRDYDTDSNSSYSRNGVYSFKSANSTPFDSPTTASSTPDRVYSPTPDGQAECVIYQDSAHLFQEKVDTTTWSSEDAEKTRTPDGQSVCVIYQDSALLQEKVEMESRSSEDAKKTRASVCDNNGLPIYEELPQKTELILDLEYNDINWLPPTENAKDETESTTFESDDGDVDTSSSVLPCSSIGDDASINQGRLNNLNEEPLMDVIGGHLRALVSQLLRGAGIDVRSDRTDGKWLQIVTFLAWQAANFVKPDTSDGGSMDPCDYVKVKCIACGHSTESTLIKGVVCTTKIKHKRMVSEYRNPRLLLLGGALEYQRLPDQLASIGTLLDEEKDYIKAKVSKIEAYGPNVLLVEKSVSPCAQEYLLSKDISLVLNVKRTVLERIARCTGAQIVPSIDSRTSPRLGRCEVFRLERVVEECQATENSNKKSKRTLMFFEGCPRHSGCTVLLRGASREWLKKVKQVVQYAVFAAYHLSLETSFLTDEGASLLHLPAEPLVTFPGYSSKLDKVIPLVLKSAISTYGNLPELEVLAQNKWGSSFYLENEDHQSPHERADPNFSFPLSPTSLDSGATSHMLAIDSLNTPTAPSSSSGSQCEMSNGLSMPSGDTFMVRMPERSLTEEEGDSILQSVTDSACEKTKLHAVEPFKELMTTVDAHQGIIVLLLSRCMITDTVCEPSQLVRIKFYGSSDKPLGRFLRDDLFDQTVHCKSCNRSTEAHVQCYIHQQGSLTIWVKQTSWELPGAHEGKIWMWHRCCKCEPEDGVSPAKKKIMSSAAWGLSFGKFLELSFSNSATANRVAPCGHSLQRDCLRYYGCGDMVAAFRYAPSNIFKVFLPSPVLEYKSQLQQEWIKKEETDVSEKMEFLYAEVFNALLEMDKKTVGTDAEPSYEPSRLNLFQHHMGEFKRLHKTEKTEYDSLLQNAAASYCQQGLVGDVFELAYLQRCLFIDLYLWDHRLLFMISLLQTQNYVSMFDVGIECKSPSCTESSREGELPPVQEGNTPKCLCSMRNMDFAASNSPAQGSLSNLYSDDPAILNSWGCVVEFYPYAENAQVSVDHLTDTSECVLLQSSALSEKIDMKWTGSVESLSASSIHLSLSDATKVGCVLPRKQNDSNPLRKIMDPVRVYSFDSQRFQERNEKSLFQTAPSLSSTRCFYVSADHRSLVGNPVLSMRRFYYRNFPSQRFDFILNYPPSFLSSSFQKLSEGPRFLLPSTGRNNIVVSVRENEPTSIIAYVLSCKEYEAFVSDKSVNVGGPKSIEKIVMDENSMVQLDSVDFQFRSYGSDINILSSKSFVISDSSKSAHFRAMVGGDSLSLGSEVRFSVTCYFAKEFDALRRKCSPNFLEYLRSLSHCQRWSAQGGKSNVYFAKTLDERFIVKQVKKTELESFEEFYQNYFKYVADSLSSGRPMCLAKILGIYQVSVKNMKSGKEDKMDLMVMENLFFGRTISKTYDLKGSVRSRCNPDTSKVLLDENLLKVLQRNPIFLGSKDKRLLERAVWNDTSFLASVDVMDYSLLVGVDEKRKELVLGIIDYMRQYTWDKHLETLVKATGILGGPKNASPTVVSPKQYKKRFRKAMSSYFLVIPDQWSS